MAILPEPLSQAWHERQSRLYEMNLKQRHCPPTGSRPESLDRVYILALLAARKDLLILALSAPAEIEILIHLAQLNLATAICQAVVVNADPEIRLADSVPHIVPPPPVIILSNEALEVLRRAHDTISCTTAIAPERVALYLERCLPWLDRVIQVGQKQREYMDKLLAEPGGDC